MPPKFALGLRACCVAVALVLSPARAADSKSPLLGATRQQVIDRLGEPKSVISAGAREILFFNRERLVLRDGVVVEVEQLASESTTRRPGAPAPEAAPTPAPPPVPEVPHESLGGQAAAPVAPAPTPETNPAPAASAGDGRLEIKSVRPQGTAARPAPKQEAPPPVAEAPKAAPVPIPTPPPVTKAKKAEPPAPTPEQLAAAAEEAAKKEKARATRRRLDDANLDEPTENIFSRTTYVLAFVVIGSGLGYLLWQRQQRKIELVATAVSRTPFNAPASSGTGARFTADFLGKLEWKRFEELVAAYYSKTGVVANRTQTGPASPVHIKISWKGEPRPFACVQCLAHPPGLVEVPTLQALVDVLAAEDIRRGYVVTTGKFSVAARDLAEEKHITLLPGDIFLEKLNALPDAARTELMQETTAGDYTTPSCPKCEAKMVRSPDDSSQWRCEVHRDQTIPVA